MDVKSTHDTLNLLARQVIKSFYPEHFIVANELLRHTEYVEAAQLAANLNLAVPTVQASLNDLLSKRFVSCISYKDVPAFWGFDYHNFYNVVTYKIHALRAKAEERSAGKATENYVCDRCERAVTWEQFAKVAMNPVCGVRGCPGRLQKGSRHVVEGLKTLSAFSAALKRVQLAQIPVPGMRVLKARLLEHQQALQAELDAAGEGIMAPSIFLLPVGESKYVVTVVPSAGLDRDGFVLPPELDMILDTSGGGGGGGGGADGGTGRATAKSLPPWLVPEERHESVAHDVAGALERMMLDASPAAAGTSAPPQPLEPSMRQFYTELARQIGGDADEAAAPMELDHDDADGDAMALEDDIGVTVQGHVVPLRAVTAAGLAAMTEPEYVAYYEAYSQLANARIAKWKAAVYP